MTSYPSAEIQYLGATGTTQPCVRAVGQMLQSEIKIHQAKLITYKTEHSLILVDAIGDWTVIKPGLTSGYNGEGPKGLSCILALLDAHKVEVDEFLISENLHSKFENAAITVKDKEVLSTISPIRPTRWYDYIRKEDLDRINSGTLWNQLPQTMPYAIIDPRLMGLAKYFLDDPGIALTKGYILLEDIVRQRTSLVENSQKLFNDAFLIDKSPLYWDCPNDAEAKSAANLFKNVYGAHRNPRAHREVLSNDADALSEFLVLNHLYRLEAKAIQRPIKKEFVDENN